MDQCQKVVFSPASDSSFESEEVIKTMSKGNFSGEYVHSLDSKGRVIVPIRHRDEGSDEYYIVKGLDPCLYIYCKEDLDALSERMSQNTNLLDQDHRILMRYLMGSRKPGEIDKQGRMLIPQNLREHAHLTKEVMLVGVGERIEVWDKQRYDEYNANLDISAIAAKLAANGVSL